MKIWIDITNSPHVNFFLEMIKELQTQNEVLLTTRPLSNTLELLDIFKLPYKIVGSHYGKNPLKKAFGFPIRILQLFQCLKREHIDVAISHSSFYSPVVSRLLGIRCIYLNDNEFAAGNRIAFLFADSIMIPEFLDSRKVQKQWASPHKISKYPGVKEGIYLWRYQPSEHGANSVPQKRGMPTIFIRPEPLTAQYYKGGVNFMDDLLVGLRERFNLVVLPRSKVQEFHYRQAKFAGIHVPDKPMRLTQIMENCDLFIGAGGTMTREAAVLGVPTISIYQDELLDVDRYLITKGAMIHERHPNASIVTEFIAKTRKRSADPELLRLGKKAYELVINTILSNGHEKIQIM